MLKIESQCAPSTHNWIPVGWEYRSSTGYAGSVTIHAKYVTIMGCTKCQAWRYYDNKPSHRWSFDGN